MFQKTLTGGRYNESNYPVQELWRKRGGGRIFEGGVLAGHYGICLYIWYNVYSCAMQYFHIGVGSCRLLLKRQDRKAEQ